MAGHSHLTRRGSTYYFRRRVPLALRRAFPFEAWIESLHTTDFEEAKRLVRARSVEIDNRITAALAEGSSTPSPPLRPDEAASLATLWLKERLDADAEWRLTSGPDWHRNQGTVLLEKAAAARCQLAKGLWRCVGGDADEVLAKAGRFYGKEDPSRRLMAGQLLEAQVAYFDAVEARQQGAVVKAPEASPLPLRAPSGQPSGRTVDDLITAYTADKAKAHGEGVVMKRYRHIFAALRELLGPQRVVSTLTRADGRAVRDFLATVPKHAGKKYPKLSLKEAVAAGERDAAPKLVPKTVASYMQNLNAMINWAAAEEWIERNPFSGLVGKAESLAERRGYTANELERLFATLIPFKGETPWRFWLPALALYTGARLNELAQLRVEDVIEVDGTPCIHISPYTAEGVQSADKRVKTAGSKRTVPLHADLVALGFVTFARGRGKGPERIFHELREGPHGGYSHEASRWFGKYLTRLGLKLPGLVFHSFRHTFRDAARDGGVPDPVAEALGGWKSRKVSDQYGSRARIKPFKSAVDALDYGEFSLLKVVAAHPV